MVSTEPTVSKTIKTAGDLCVKRTDSNDKLCSIISRDFAFRDTCEKDY